MVSDKISKVHFIGAAGAGMSALYNFLKEKGLDVTGSDKSSDFPNHNEQNITNNIDLIVYSLAIPDNNVELVKAKTLKIKTLSYPEALGLFFNEYETLVTVAGTHGKTTVTSMIVQALVELEQDPSIIVGASSVALGNKNYRVGESDIAVIEACEYKEAFLNYQPNIAVINNIDIDHLDYFKTEENYRKVFEDLINNISKDGWLVINKKSIDIVGEIDRPDLQVIAFDDPKDEFNLKVPGKHNRMNAEAAYTVLRLLGTEHSKAIKALNDYSGVKRRLEYIGQSANGAFYYDDYAHHPDEIKVTLQALREKYPDNNLTVVFQPHLYSRTKKFYDQFVDAFGRADKVIIPNIYAARDVEADSDLTAEKLAQDIQNGEFIDGLKKTAEWIKENQKEGDVIITMGAGDVNKIWSLI